MQQRNGGFNGEYQLKFEENGKINFWSYRDGYKWSVTSMGSYNDNYWHHLVIVQDNTINGGRLYIDGIENVPKAFIGMMNGNNFGKLLIRLNN